MVENSQIDHQFLCSWISSKHWIVPKTKQGTDYLMTIPGPHIRNQYTNVRTGL